MPTFHYQAVRRNGDPQSGEVLADNRKMASELLLGQDLFPVKITRGDGGGFWGFLTRDLSDPTRAYKDGLAPVSLQLAKLLEAGVTVDQALAVLAEGGLSRAWTLVIADMRMHIRDGLPLSAAAAKHPNAFPTHFVALLSAGEKSGTLPHTLTQLASMAGRRDETRAKIKTALIYPLLLLALSVCTVLFVLFFVLPQFEGLLREGWSNLPWSTKLLFGMRYGLIEFWWVLLLIAGGITFAVYRLKSDSAFLHRRDRWLIEAPLLGGFLTDVEAENLCQTAGGLMGAGVSVPEAFGLAAAGVGNRHIRSGLNGVVEQIKHGMSPSVAIAESALLPQQVVQLIKSGEDAGKLPEMLGIGADLLGTQIQAQTDRFLSVLTPALTILMGIIVGGTVASVFSALLSVNELVF